MKNVIVSGRFSLNGVVYGAGSVVSVDENMNSIQTLIRMKHLKLTNEQVKEVIENKIETNTVDSSKDVLDWKTLTKPKLDKYAEEQGCKLDGRKSLQTMREQFQTFLDAKENPEDIETPSDEEIKKVLSEDNEK